MNRFDLNDRIRGQAGQDVRPRPVALLIGLLAVLVLAQALPARTSPPTAEMFIKHALQLRG